MNPTFDMMARKKILVAAVVALSALTATGIVLKSRSSLAARDRNSLKQQRAAMGMPDPGQRRARMLEEMARTIGLTETQKAQVKAAMEAGPDRRSLFGDRSLSREQRFARMRQAWQEREARVQAILTPTQQARYDQWQAQRRERFRGMGRPGRGPGGPGGFSPPASNR